MALQDFFHLENSLIPPGSLLKVMEASRGKQQHSLRGYKASSFPYNRHHENSNYTVPSGHGFFKTSRIQRHSLKWRKDHYSRGGYRSRFPYRKADVGLRKTNKSAEDLEEEERKKKLTDTAKILLSKIKTWNAESNPNEEESQQNCNVSSVSQTPSETSCKHNEEKITSEGKPKRIAHSKKVKLVKNRTPKSFNQPTKPRYDVNKETVKDFQNRIQHKLIEEIMQMPKENLQNVLNDPKINPRIDVKMSRLVKENKLLIAQKLRTLAESKMKSPGCSTNPQLLVDIDKLIDPVIETDLSVLPFELIKQMENIFQVQFDYSPNAVSQVESGACDSATNSSNAMADENPMEVINNSDGNVKTENNEDLSLYECSTDEDEFDSYICGVLNQELTSQMQEAMESQTEVNNEDIKEKNLVEFEPVDDKTDESPPPNVIQVPIINPSSSQSIPEEPEKSSPAVEFTSSGCQTEGSFTDSSTQTTAPSQVQTLYGIPLPKESTNETIFSLLEEVSSIQNLTNKLNERRFKIFLQLAKLNPSGNFMSDDNTKNNFIETLSNGNLFLVESLKQFFTNHQHGRHKNRFKKKQKHIQKD